MFLLLIRYSVYGAHQVFQPLTDIYDQSLYNFNLLWKLNIKSQKKEAQYFYS